MASSSSVLTMGLGSWGSASLVVTLGYGLQATLDATVDEAATFRAWKRLTLATTTRATLAQTARRPTRFVGEERGTR